MHRTRARRGACAADTQASIRTHGRTYSRVGTSLRCYTSSYRDRVYRSGIMTKFSICIFKKYTSVDSGVPAPRGFKRRRPSATVLQQKCAYAYRWRLFCSSECRSLPPAYPCASLPPASGRCRPWRVMARSSPWMGPWIAAGESVIKCPSPLTVLNGTYDHGLL